MGKIKDGYWFVLLENTNISINFHLRLRLAAEHNVLFYQFGLNMVQKTIRKQLWFGVTMHR